MIDRFLPPAAAAAVALLLILCTPLCEAQPTGPSKRIPTQALRPLEASSSAAWAAHRERVRKEWLSLLGPPPPACPLEPRIIRADSLPDHDRILVTYQTEPGIRTDAYLLIPRPLSSRAPGAIVFHATTEDHILQPVGLASRPSRHLALHLVRRGYVTLSPRCFIYGYANPSESTAPISSKRGPKEFTSATEHLLRRRPGWTGMGKMLHDGQKAVDYLLTRPEVDPARLAAVGHSLGAKEALYLCAFDPRIRAGFASEGGIGLRSSNWDAVWYLGDSMSQIATGQDHHELLALISPRSFLVAGGGASDGDHTRPYIEAAQAVHALYGRPESLKLDVHAHGHDIPDEIREAGFHWLDRTLAYPLPPRREANQ